MNQVPVKTGSHFYYATLFLSPEQKKLCWPIIELIYRVKRIPRFSQDANIVHSQFAWWQQELAHLQNATGTHPLCLALVDSGALSAVIIQSMIDFVAAVEIDYVSAKSQLPCSNSLGSSVKLFHAIEQQLEIHPISDTQAKSLLAIINRLDVLDGFHQDNAQGLNYLNSLSTQNETVTASNQDLEHNILFWKQSVEQLRLDCNHIWNEITLHRHPLTLVVLIYSILRIRAWQKNLNKPKKSSGFCYNPRPSLTPFWRFWLSWRIASRFGAGLTPPKFMNQEIEIESGKI